MLNELYLGAEWSNLGDGELVDRFPWFSNGGPDAISDVPPAQRPRAFEAFAARVSEQVVELTHAVLRNRSGRTLIKVFPDQLHPSALEELLQVFRPRLLVPRLPLTATEEHFRNYRVTSRQARTGSVTPTALSLARRAASR